MSVVPLSEDEQRILQQIEQQFYASDPDLAGEMGSHTLFAHCRRQMRWAAIGFVIGLAVLLVTLAFATSFLASFAGFVLMLVSALWFERSLRKLGRAGMAQLMATVRAGGLRDYFGDTSDRMRHRLRRDDPPPPPGDQS